MVTTLTNLNCLLKYCKSLQDLLILVFLFCGDWNVVQNKSDDTYNVIQDRNQNARKKIEELKETFELLDPWRTCYPVDKKFTWRQTSPIKQSRIDYFLVSEDIFSLMEYTKIIPGYRTDHCAIVFSFFCLSC